MTTNARPLLAGHLPACAPRCRHLAFTLALAAFTAFPVNASPPRLASVVERSSALVELQPLTYDGWRYRIEATSDLAAWADLGQADLTDGVLLASDPPADQAHRFYRLAVPRARMLAPLAPPNLPEGLAMDAAGNAFVSLAPTGEILKIAPNGTAAKLAQLPSLVAGLALDAQNTLLVCVAPQPSDPAKHGVWRITPDGQAALWAALPPDSLPNDVLLDRRGRVFVTDSITAFGFSHRKVCFLSQRRPRDRS